MSDNSEINQLDPTTQEKRGRGRPKKEIIEKPEPKQRGRPKKEKTTIEEPKQRGRPKKEKTEQVKPEPKKRGRKLGTVMSDRKTDDPNYFKNYYEEHIKGSFTCQYCNRVFNHKNKLTHHQTNTRYCLMAQHIQKISDEAREDHRREYEKLLNDLKMNALSDTVQMTNVSHEHVMEE